MHFLDSKNCGFILLFSFFGKKLARKKKQKNQQLLHRNTYLQILGKGFQIGRRIVDNWSFFYACCRLRSAKFKANPTDLDNNNMAYPADKLRLVRRL